MESEWVSEDDSVRTQFGTYGFFCVEHFLWDREPDLRHETLSSRRFWGDHEVNKQLVKVVCLNLS